MDMNSTFIHKLIKGEIRFVGRVGTKYLYDVNFLLNLQTRTKPVLKHCLKL